MAMRKADRQALQHTCEQLPLEVFSAEGRSAHGRYSGSFYPSMDGPNCKNDELEVTYITRLAASNLSVRCGYAYSRNKQQRY